MVRILFLLCLAAGPAFGADPVIIGLFMPLSGNDASYGEMALPGAQLAVADLNARGGLLGRPVTLAIEDDRSAPGEAATAVKRLIGRDHAVAVVGEITSARTLEGAPIAQAAAIPLITPGATSPRVTAVGNAIFRACFVDSFQGQVIATFARRRLGLSKAAILVDATSPYSVGLADYFAKTFVSQGGTIVSTQRYAGKDTDFRAQLTAIRSAQPDALFLPGYYVAAGLVARQAKELGLGATLLGGDGFEAPQLIQIGGEAINGAYYCTHFLPEGGPPAAQAFVAAFRRTFGREPNGISALTYDAVGLAADAIVRAGTTERHALREALARTRDFPGISGRITINASRDAEKEATIVQVRGGKLAFVEELRP